MAQPVAPSRAPQLLSGGLWLVGGLLLPIGTGLLLGVAVAVLTLAIWCMASAVLIGRRR